MNYRLHNLLIAILTLALLWQQGGWCHSVYKRSDGPTSSLRPLARAERGLPAGATPADTLNGILARYGLRKGVSNMLPDPHQPLMVIDETGLEMGGLEKAVFGTNSAMPRLVSVPVRLIPQSLANLLRQIKVTSISNPNQEINVHDYLIQNIDFVIFAPYIARVDQAGRVTQLGGAIPWDTRMPVSPELLVTNLHHPGKRVLYLAMGKIVNSETGDFISHIDESAKAELGRFAVENDGLYSLIEEIAHMEIMRLVIAGRLPREFLESPQAIQWQEKAASTVIFTSLTSMEEALTQIQPADSAAGFIDLATKSLLAKINQTNAALGIPKDDLGFGRFGTIIPSAAKTLAMNRATANQPLSAI
jgi:hypothetical protein